jgi:hypothetical protein
LTQASFFPELLPCRASSKRAGWLRVDRLLGEWGIRKDSPAGRKHFGLCMEHRRRQESPKTDWKAVERGWFPGDKGFRNELLAQMQHRRGDYYRPELREADLAHAERVLKEELDRRTWTELELRLRRKGDPQKVEIASQLRAGTTMTLKWIAQRLNMGTWTYVSNCLVQKRKRTKSVNSYDRPLVTAYEPMGSRLCIDDRMRGAYFINQQFCCSWTHKRGFLLLMDGCGNAKSPSAGKRRRALR